MDIHRGAQQDLHHLTARFNQKGCLQVLGGDALNTPYRKFSKIWQTTAHNFPPSAHRVIFPPLKSHRYGILSMPYGFRSCQEWGNV
jgi:hypothetical protein